MAQGNSQHYPGTQSTASNTNSEGGSTERQTYSRVWTYSQANGWHEAESNENGANRAVDLTQ